MTPLAAGFFSSLLDHITASPATYAVLVGICLGDAVLPLFPSETAMIAAAIAVTRGELLAPLVIGAGAVGSFLGDNVAYGVGAGAGGRVVGWLERGDKGQRQLDWARQQLRRRGRGLILVGRFIPGGRTATNVAAGSFAMPWRRFLPADALAALLWALYAFGLGYLGGSVFSGSPWKAVVVSLAIAAVVGLAGELARRHSERSEAGT